MNGTATYYTAGNVGIGVFSPDYPLDVSGDTQFAIRSESSLIGGVGVWGISSATTGAGGGLWGVTNGDSGKAVYGVAQSPHGPTVGVVGLTSSTSGTGILGKAEAPTGQTVGVYGETVSPDGWAGFFQGGRNYFEGNVGIGVTSPDYPLDVGANTQFAIRSESSLTGGVGVWGISSATTGSGGGLWGVANGDSGKGVYGVAQSASGSTVGVEGRSSSTSGAGVFGKAEAATGQTVGVHGEAVSPDGWAGYFVGTKNYFSGDVGIGNAQPVAPLHVGNVGKWGWTVGNGWGDFTLSNGAVGLGIGVATGGGGTGDVRIWPRGGTERLFFGTPTEGTVMTIDNGYVGFGGLGTPAHPIDVAGGAYCTGSTWQNASSRELKENFTELDARQVLDKVLSLEVARWNYKQDHPEVAHIGPIAEEFEAAFALGGDNKSISTVDADGVALAAIQGLHQIIEEKDAELVALRTEKDAEIAELRARLVRLERVVDQLTWHEHE